MTPDFNLFRVASQIFGPLRSQFEMQLSCPEKTQRNLLAVILREMESTSYGRHFELSPSMSPRDFSNHAPIVNYESIRPWIQRQRISGEPEICPGNVKLYEMTSGSSGSSKAIPYNSAVLASFQRMFLLWSHDMLQNGPRIESGRTFMSVSPPPFETPGLTTSGLADDADYLSPVWRSVIRKFLTLPPEIKKISDGPAYLAALAQLIACDSRLEIISIWNPSLLLRAMDWISANRALVLKNALCGSIQWQSVRIGLKPIAHRTRTALLSSVESLNWGEIWPSLKLISCWGGVHAAPLLQELALKFPRVFIQPKGLLATEAPMTLPWIKAGGFVPLPAEIYYEFETHEGRLLGLSELARDASYNLIITQKGGLLRYRIGDRVRVTGTYLDSPILEFIGRADAVVDLVGEKLHEEFVASCLHELSSRVGSFRAVIPEGGSVPGYTLVVDQLGGTEGVDTQMELLLFGGHHYRIARALGQLRPLELIVNPNAARIFSDYYLKRGIKLGDQKPRSLVVNLEDARELLAEVRRK